MNYTDAIIEIGKANGGYIIGKQIRERNIPSIYLTRMKRQGVVRSVAYGVSLLSDFPEDEFFTYALCYERAVYSRHTALYLNGMSNRQLEFIEANFPANYNIANIQGVRGYRTSEELYELGKSIVITLLGHEVNSYNIERCICDLFYYDDFDIEEKSFAIKSLDKSKLNYDRLFTYAKQMKVLPQVKSVFEVI